MTSSAGVRMTCEEFKEMAAAYVLGVLDDGERKSCLAHLQTEPRHNGCAAALDEARQVSTHLAAALPVTAPPAASVWRAIEARAGRVATSDRTVRLRAMRELSAWFIAAAVLGLYLYGGHLDTQRRAVAEPQPAGARSATAVRAAIGLLGKPGTRVLPFRPAATATEARATLVVGAGDRDPAAATVPAVVMGDRLERPAGQQLGLWVEREAGGAEPLGVLDLSDDHVAAAELDLGRLDRRGPARLVVSLDDVTPAPVTPREVLMTVDVRFGHDSGELRGDPDGRARR